MHTFALMDVILSFVFFGVSFVLFKYNKNFAERTAKGATEPLHQFFGEKPWIKTNERLAVLWMRVIFYTAAFIAVVAAIAQLIALLFFAG
jgi:preprotein translocase subunit SecY